MNLVTRGNQARHELSSNRSRRTRDKHSHRQLLDRGTTILFFHHVPCRITQAAVHCSVLDRMCSPAARKSDATRMRSKISAPERIHSTFLQRPPCHIMRVSRVSYI